MKIIEEPQLAVKRKWPWFVDIFLYPLSISGLIHLVIFLCAPILISLIHRFILGYIWPIGELIVAILYLLFVGYVLYYLSWCVIDSTKGRLRAPDIALQLSPAKEELLGWVGILLACTAVCFCPVAVYYIFTERANLTFWLLFAIGFFFLPMALLRGVLFDSLDALNPISIIGSIFRTFFSYCGLVLFICAPGALIAVIISNLSKPYALQQTPFYISMVLNYLLGTAFIYQKIAFIYLAMVAAHLLGRFYWWHKDKLDWGL